MRSERSRRALATQTLAFGLHINRCLRQTMLPAQMCIQVAGARTACDFSTTTSNDAMVLCQGSTFT